MHSSPTYLFGLLAVALTASSSMSLDDESGNYQKIKRSTHQMDRSLLRKRALTKSIHLQRRSGTCRLPSSQSKGSDVQGAGSNSQGTVPTTQNVRSIEQSSLSVLSKASDVQNTGSDAQASGLSSGKGSDVQVAGSNGQDTVANVQISGSFDKGANIQASVSTGKSLGSDTKSTVTAIQNSGSSVTGASAQGKGSSGQVTESIKNSEGNSSEMMIASDTIRDDTDPSMVKTQCQTDGRADNIIGLDGTNFGSIQNGDMPPTCGRRMELYNPKTGKRTIGIALDRVWQNNGVNHGGYHQADVSSRLNRELGGNGKDNIGQIQMRFL